MRYTNFILTTSSRILSIQLICPLGMGSVGELCECMCVVGEWVCAWVCINKKTINMSMTTYIHFNDVNTMGLVLSLKKFKIQKRTSNLPACCPPIGQTFSKIYDNKYMILKGTISQEMHH